MPWARSFCPFRACGAKLAKLEIFDIPPLGGRDLAGRFLLKIKKKKFGGNNYFFYLCPHQAS